MSINYGILKERVEILLMIDLTHYRLIDSYCTVDKSNKYAIIIDGKEIYK